MNRLRLVSAAIMAAMLCAGAVAWLRCRPPAVARQTIASTVAPARSAREELRQAMARWLLREGRRHLRCHRFRAAAAVAVEVAFFAGDAGALPLREALEEARAAMRARWRAMENDAAEAGDHAAGRRFQELLEEVDGLERAGAEDPR